MPSLLHRVFVGGILRPWPSGRQHVATLLSQRAPKTGAIIDKSLKELLEDWDFEENPQDSRKTVQQWRKVGPSKSENEAGNTSNSVKKRLPADVRCFDTARIYLKSGNGGNGCVAFRREKFVAKGGPSGGGGGRGGHVWAVADHSLNSLLGFRRQIHWRAKNGCSGQGSNKRGSDGQDLYIPVPPGTLIRWKGAEPSEPPVAELVTPGQKALLLSGGRGGRGNASFKTSKTTAPQLAENGEEGTEAWVDLELKLVADVGIIGVPNAGKSTLLSRLSAATPKIADYPFTTLRPNLGVCEMDYETTVFADVPGLLEGAAQGIGLGHEFLRHCQRCKVLIHIVDGSSADPLGDYEAIQLELKLFNPELQSKHQAVVYNKMDIPDAAERWSGVRKGLIQLGVDAKNLFSMCAVTGDGVTTVVRRARQLLKDSVEEDSWGSSEDVSVQKSQKIAINDRLDDYWVEEIKSRTPRQWIIHGQAIERFAQMTNWEYFEALKRFQRVLEASGISGTLNERGIKEGDIVVIGKLEFDWRDDNSETALYGGWLESRKESGKPRKGRRSWPHVGG